MIDKQELKLGNWVETTGGYAQVSELLEDTCSLSDGDIWLYADLEAVDLSPSILEKCGFEKHDASNQYWTHYVMKNGWRISIALHSEKSAGVKEGLVYWGDLESTMVELKSLHSLQNLYFATTNQELEITL